MSNTIEVALDVHGGDHGIPVTVPAAIEALRTDESLRLILVGIEEDIARQLDELGHADSARIEIEPAESVLPNDAAPMAAIRRGRGSSLGIAFDAVAGGRADACVSAGSTAAMMVFGARKIGMLEGIERPALMAFFPTMTGETGLLDIGANIHASAEHLVQYAVMGYETAQVRLEKANPSIGLLNVGHEDNKGGDRVRQAHETLSQLPLNYTGFIEGHDLYAGKVDVAVCDGFAGNLVLKASEGLARMLMQEVRTALMETLWSRLGALLASGSLRRLVARRDPSAHNGAPLLGLKGVAVKSHGSADILGTTRAILEARREADRKVPEKINNSIHQYHLETHS